VTGSIESPEARAILKAFDQGLREYGYIDGQNVLVVVRAADLKVERFPALASELVRLNVDLIVAIEYARRACRTASYHHYSHCRAGYGRSCRRRARC